MCGLKHFFTSQITHGLITWNVFSINYFYSFFNAFLPLSLSKLNLKNCYFAIYQLRPDYWMESALFTSAIYLIYSVRILLIFAFLAWINIGDFTFP